MCLKEGLTGQKVGTRRTRLHSSIVPETNDRQEKPRQRGVTMVIDKGLGMTATADLLDLAADYIDLIKFGFGTTLLYAPDAVRRKVKMIVDAGVAVLPGGTLLEIAVHQGTVKEFFKLARDAGFTHVEVSDGTVELPRNRRRELIRRAKDLGLRVISEVGKKDPSRPLQSGFALEQIALDLHEGVEKVIVEGRDSGRNIGIYDQSGGLRDQLFEDMVAGLPSLDDVIWEAPQSAQQQTLLMRLGPHTNFGNVQPPDVVTLEAMRRGLRGDTLRLRLGEAQDAWAQTAVTEYP